ncbi:MAG: helix-turn-helix domain-containing protein [Proteobacteria bacterium]|nr:helix-turn-helix domain-containing protein [Pseudomonadota bacterium]
MARKAKPIGRRKLGKIVGIITPDTLLRWYQKLIAQKYDGSEKRGPGRPRIAGTIQELIFSMARDNAGWGYTRIKGALKNLGHEVGRSTIQRILRENGFDPAPLSSEL